MPRTIATAVAVIVVMAAGADRASAQGTSTVDVMLSGYGTVTAGGYSCTNVDFESGACPPLTASIGSTVVFSAAPAPITVPGSSPAVTAPVSSSFVGWSRPECEGTGTCAMKVEDDEEAIVAHFSPVWLEVFVTGNDDGGTTVGVSASKPAAYCLDNCMTGLFDTGTRVDVRATPAPASGQWTFGCDPFLSELSAGDCVIEMSNIENFVSLALNGAEPTEPPFNLKKPVTVKRAGSGDGRVEGSGTDAEGTPWSIYCGTDCKLTGIQYQTRIRLRAVEGTRSAFQGWAGPPCGSQNICTFTAGKYPTVRATFSRKPSSSGPGQGKAPFSMSVSRAKARGRHAKRRIVVTLTTNRSARATLRLTRKGKRVAAKSFTLPAGTRTITLKVPRRARAGRYRLSLTVTAADGTRKSFSKRVRLRR